MNLSNYDVVISIDGQTFGYVLNPEDPRSIVHSSEAPNVPLNTGVSTPTQAGGVYDVRDSSGDKAITHLDWSGGAGQDSLDTEDAAYSRFQSSTFIDTSQRGKLMLARPFTSTHLVNVAGPMYSALGMLWMGYSNGTLAYSLDNGNVWGSATITDGPTSTIGGFASNGETIFLCASGAVPGLWSWDGSGSVTFQKYTSITAPLERLAYNNGTLYGATGDGAGVISLTANSGEGSYTEETASYLTGANSTVDLVTTQNSVYWVVSKNGQSQVYRLWDDAGTIYTEQFAEFPQGFVATCAVGYLGNVDVGGYFESVSGVGQGAVYRTTADGEMSVLFKIGKRPEDTPTPTSLDNDNRIRACVAGGLDTYWLTERELFRWDLDSGGYNHIGDFLGCGAPSRVVTGAEADTLPTGGDVIEPVGEYKVHTFTNSGTFTVPVHRDSNGNLVSTVPVEYIVVAGGGGGGVNIGGGGGAGEVLTGTGKLLSGAVTVTVGAGGASAASGSNSVLSDITALGGGKGGNSATAGTNGGSGGGAGVGTDGTPEAGGTGGTGGHAGGANEFYTGGGGAGSAGGGGGAGDTGEDGVEEVPS